MTRLRKLYHAYEGHNDKLEVLNSNNGHQAEFANVQVSALAGKVENTLNVASTSNAGSNIFSNETQIVNTRFMNPIKKRIKLPETSLPTFDGKHENWLSLKTRFIMRSVHERTSTNYIFFFFFF